MSFNGSAHLGLAQKSWARMKSMKPGQAILVTGEDLDLGTVVAVSRKNCLPQLPSDEHITSRINGSVQQLEEYLSKGHSVYGVTTGFGGSADSRTKQMNKLQVALLQLTQSGVLLDSDKKDLSPPSEYFTESNAMPSSWVKATMMVRCNATARGHSAVTLKVLEAILQLLRLGITPIVPLRGTVSASGDLMPLAFIAGVLEGNPDICARRADGSIVSADQALADANMPSITFGPKEALGLVNGTAPSAALGSLVMYDAHQLAVLSQAFTAMTVEAMTGNSESFHPFIHKVRPHDGQIEAGKNILAFLQESSFAKGIKSEKDRNPSGMAQDRYALRSAPQWIGPQLEDLCYANQQITTELNSSADNPLVDVEAKEVYYGANFQAAAVTSAMEKTRSALQMLGRLFFAQSTELIDPNLNNGLPTNLAADDPSVSFTMKGVDINMAAYMSELAFLASPVSTHVQTAEMHNQSINSLAFLSARMTRKAVELTFLMCASCIYIGCQALDLRALQFNFFSEVKVVVEEINQATLSSYMTVEELAAMNKELTRQISETWKDASRLDISNRFERICRTLVTTLLSQLEGHTSRREIFKQIDLVDSWKDSFKYKLKTTYDKVFQQFCQKPNTVDYIGVGSRALYNTVRHDLRVPFHQGVIEHPAAFHGDNDTPKRQRKTVGGWISIIYDAVLKGQFNDALYKTIGEYTNRSNGHVNRSNRHVNRSNGHVNRNINGHANGPNGHANEPNGHVNGSDGHVNGSSGYVNEFLGYVE
ncbi:phenylalanine ammonia-lyase [Glonium stellatum]|uniref:Phenylalanine ammonia-lyase n=1 Tax=Glonium stellatum TaxID=574774 RepID=A0A8E2F8A4_9PEZI|nr:phenylalanine ammonia-lyase [Glonium stellatum]